MAIKKYCIYFPYRLDVDLLESIIDDNQLYTCIKRYIVYDNDLDNKLSTIKNFIRYKQESELCLLKKDDQIQAIVFSRDGYKPYNILPIINDMNNMQCFIAISNNWIELNEITTYSDTNSFIIQEDRDIIQNLYDSNKENLLPLIDQALSKLFQYYNNKQLNINNVENNSNIEKLIME